MGQAKLRGTQEQRILAAKAKIDALRPTVIICNDCKSEISDIHDMNIRGMDGIDAAFAGICEKCKGTTFAIKGNPEAVEALMMAMTETNGEAKALVKLTPVEAFEAISA